jgi:hypothetical protein
MEAERMHSSLPGGGRPRPAALAWAFGGTVVGWLVLSACTHAAPASLGLLQQRAVLDAGCPAQYLSLQHLDARTKLVTGCGVQLVYVESCEDARGETLCSWLLDAARADPAASAGHSPWGAGVAGQVPVSGWPAYSPPSRAPASAGGPTVPSATGAPEVGAAPPASAPPASAPPATDWLGPEPAPQDRGATEYRPQGL